jgi:hypothetical protein
MACTILHNRNFRMLLLARSISSLGDLALPVAMAFAIIEITGSALSLGLVLGVRSTAFALSVLIGGVVSDRLPR